MGLTDLACLAEELGSRLEGGAVLLGLCATAFRTTGGLRTPVSWAVQSPERVRRAMRRGFAWTDDAWELAARGGHLATLSWASTVGPYSRYLLVSWGKDAAWVAAAAGGQVAVLQWFEERLGGAPGFREAVCHGAARAGRVGVLEWLASVGARSQALEAATKSDHAASLDWAYAECGGVTWNLPWSSGFLTTWRWTRDHGVVPEDLACNGDQDSDEDPYVTAARAASTEALDWLVTQGRRLRDVEELLWAQWHPDVVLWLLENGILDPADFPRVGCPLQTMQLALDRGCDMSAELFAAAVEKGPDETVEWLMRSGCPMDGWASAAAAKTGNVGRLATLLEAGAPLQWARGAALANDRLRHWAGPRSPGDTEAVRRYCDTLLRRRDFGAARNVSQRWGLELVCDGGSFGHRCTAVLCSSVAENLSSTLAAEGDLKTLRDAHAAGLPITCKTLAAAVREGHMPVVRWLTSMGCAYSREAFEAARWSGRIEAYFYGMDLFPDVLRGLATDSPTYCGEEDLLEAFGERRGRWGTAPPECATSHWS